MLLEDYFDAVGFKAYGVPAAKDWVDELRQRALMSSFNILM
jgi:hypothetical protein